MSSRPTAARWPGIDLLRGLTVAVMILVNQWAGVSGLPAWMKHMPADADAMSFVDMVFPAFLFIVGMSLPFALQARIDRDGRVGALKHAAGRCAALLVLGLFMVNAEMAPAGFAASAWLLAAFAGVFLAWGSVAGGPLLGWPWRTAGAVMLAALAATYPGGMGVHWWGILGLIGWAYGLAALLFIAAPPTTRLLLALAALPVCVAWFAFAAPHVGGDGHATHTLLVLAGMASTLLLQGPHPFRRTDTLTAALFAAGLAAHALWPLSKINATPSWGLLCAAATLLLYRLVCLVVDTAPGRAAQAVLGDAARHPLLAYLIPFVLIALATLVAWDWPTGMGEGWAGIVRGGVYLAWVLVLLKLLLRAGLRLRL